MEVYQRGSYRHKGEDGTPKTSHADCPGIGPLVRPLSDTEGEIAHTLSKPSQAIMNDTSFVRKSIPALEMGVDAIQQDQDRHRHDKILEWISPTDFPAQQSDFIARKQEGTSLWFLNSPKFTKWFRGKKQTLSRPGIPEQARQ